MTLVYCELVLQSTGIVPVKKAAREKFKAQILGKTTTKLLPLEFDPITLVVVKGVGFAHALNLV